MDRKTLLALACLLAAQSAWAQAPRKGSSDTDKLEASAEQLARMKTSLKQVLARVEEARNEKDVVKLNCVNEKLTQMRALLKVAEQADLALREAMTRKDPAGETELVKVGIARSKADRLRAESEQCIGRLAYVVDDKTTVEVQQPANLPGEASEDEARERRRRGPPYPAPPIVRPPNASPWYP